MDNLHAHCLDALRFWEAEIVNLQRHQVQNEINIKSFPNLKEKQVLIKFYLNNKFAFFVNFLWSENESTD